MQEHRIDHSNNAGTYEKQPALFQPPDPNDTFVDLYSLFQVLGADPKKNIEAIVKKTAELVGGELTYYCRFNGPTGRICAWEGAFSPYGDGDPIIPLDGSVSHDTFEDKDTPVVIEDLAMTPYAQSDRSVRALGSASFLGCPVSNERGLMGSLVLLDAKKRTYSRAEIQIISILAKAVSLEEARLQKDLELSRRLSFENMLKKLSSRGLRAVNVDELLDGGLEIMGRTVGVGATYVYLYDPAKNTIDLAGEWHPDSVAPHGLDLTAIRVSDVQWSLSKLMEGVVLNISDIDGMPDGREKEIARALGTAAFLIVPMFIESEFIGCLGFEDYEKSRAWGEEDVVILQTAAEIISKAFENIRLKERHVTAINKQDAALVKATRKLKSEIEERKSSIRRLRDREKELARTNARLKDMNKALTVLFSKHNDDITRMEEQIAHNIREIIDPSLQRLKNSRLKDNQLKWLGVLETTLNDIASPLASRLSTGLKKLTPTEIKIASFIKHGNTNKEIGELLGISSRTVEVHRCNMRKKLGIKNRNMNLRTFLLSVE
jgi:GAF domain-containing protein/DNA-binding CsgD family transcriptional regulator